MTPKKLVCPKCKSEKFSILSEDLKNVTEIVNNIGNFYDIIIKCSLCGEEHCVNMGSD